VLRNGGVKCFGSNTPPSKTSFGILGSGDTTTDTIAEPVDVVGLSSGVVELGAGLATTCARKADGAILCWGFNGADGDPLGGGQLGANIGSSTVMPVPVPVVGFPEP